MPPIVKDAEAIVTAQPVERFLTRLGEDDVANLLQDALEEDAADRKLDQTVAALGLLLASLELSASKGPAYAETEASASRTR